MRFASSLSVGICLLVAGASSPACRAGSHVAPIDLLRHDGSAKADLKKASDTEIEWSLPTGAGQTIKFDLAKLGIDPKQYDEIRFELKPLVSQVGMYMTLYGHPEPDLSSGWYLKFRTQTGQWSEGRFDLHLDDDGLFRGKLKNKDEAGKFTITFYRRILGYPGEPNYRKALFRNVRFVKRLVSAEFFVLETQIDETPGEVAFTYALHVKNQTKRKLTARLELDAHQTLKYFQTSADQLDIDLAPGEEKVVPVRVFIETKKAMALPPLYSEPMIPKVSIPGIEDSDVIPLRGYRRWPMWGTIPIFNRKRWTPVTLQAFLDARAKAMPGIAAWRNGVIGSAGRAMKYDWPIPDFGPPIHDQLYRCAKCGCWLKPIVPNELRNHQCPKCKKQHLDDDRFSRAWLMRYNSGRARDIRSLALAYLMTGKVEYAEKATEMFLNYAEGYAKMPIVGTRSTSGQSKMGANSLHSSYVVPIFAEAYNYLATAPTLGEGRREKIVDFLKQMGRNVGQHSVEYNNQQAEHLRAYGSVGIATGFWPLAAEAIYGDFGFHEVAEYGYSEDGIAHEGGGYHRAVFYAMNEFAALAYCQGVNLLTSRFKRVFDGSLAAGFFKGSALYELAYRVYDEPRYLPTVVEARQHVRELSALFGVLGVPSVEQMPAESVLMPGAGYIHLRKGNAADWMGISINYIKQFDRTERDKFTTFFYRNGAQVDSTIGRITYGSPHCHWMYQTAAHNCIVIDGKSERAFEGQLVACDLSAETPVAAVATNPETPFYEGVSQLRCVAVIEDVYVVLDRVVCDKARTIDRYQYGKGIAKLQFKTQKHDALSCLPEPGEFSQLEGGKCGRELRVHFPNGLKMRLVCDGEMGAYKAITIGGYQARPVEVTFARRAAAKEATFLAAFTLGQDKQPPALEIVKSTDQELIGKLTIGDQAYQVEVRPGQKQVVVSKP